MSSPAPPAPPPFPPHFHPSDTPFYSQNQEPWPTQQHFPPSSHFTPDFPQFPQPESHLIEPPFKKSRSSEDLTLSNPDPRTPNSNPQRFHNPPQFEYGPEKIRGIGRMFFKTKLCSKFKLGTCPYTTNCNFAHGNEEIRKPPPNWQEIIAAHDEDRSVRLERREDSHGSFPGPSDYQRINRLRICKRFYSGEGCPYGDRCAFHHEEPERARESVTICTTDGDRGGPDSTEISNGSNGGGSNGLYQRPVYWKTRICNKWETTGDCPFGDNCHFAHGQAELQKYIRGFTELNSNSSFASFKHLLSPTDDTSPNQRSFKQGQGHRSFPKLKGSTKINRIYADWIDDKELNLSVRQQLVEQN